MAQRDEARRAWGDFQTPEELAREACSRLLRAGCQPASLVEPTCGQGSFLRAGLQQFSSVRDLLGVEINPAYLAAARASLTLPKRTKAQFLEQSAFAADWEGLLHTLPEPLLVLGNPPWVTTADQGRRASGNVPKRSNVGLRGLDAQTGKSNFDVSEWILRRLLTAMAGREGTLAMLVKTAVARKVHAYAVAAGLPVADAWLAKINAQQAFGAAVPACLYVCRMSRDVQKPNCDLVEFENLAATSPQRVTGVRAGRLVADIRLYERWQELRSDSAPAQRWRSGIKHDAASVLELTRPAAESLELEPESLAPLLKSSDLLQGRTAPSRWLLVTQRSMQEEPARLAVTAPKAWAYLQRHAAALAARKSRIYRNRPPFAMFGVGPYSFTPAKVAISGFAKELRFTAVGRSQGQPVVFDDVCTFLPCRSLAAARRLTAALHARPAQEFLSSLIFWDAKRPVTVDVLQQLDLARLEPGRSRLPA